MRLTKAITGALRKQWRASTTRRLVRTFAASRTVTLLEEIDDDARTLRHYRDVVIPARLSQLAEEKKALLPQLFELMDEPVTQIRPEASLSKTQQAQYPRGGWTPSKELPPGPLFPTNRTPNV
ncbi:MAG: hypothetical protein LCH79_16495 [Proteobacteria bacterium]|nr:hypothetical protein [Pseudomonadota bacterium]